MSVDWSLSPVMRAALIVGAVIVGLIVVAVAIGTAIAMCAGGATPAPPLRCDECGEPVDVEVAHRPGTDVVCPACCPCELEGEAS